MRASPDTWGYSTCRSVQLANVGPLALYAGQSVLFFNVTWLYVSIAKLTMHVLGVIYTIDRLPEGYCLFDRPRGTNPSMVRLPGVFDLTSN